MLTCFLDIEKNSGFPIQNLPYGVFSHQQKPARIGVAIGDYVLDLTELENQKILKTDCFQSGTLNNFIRAGQRIWSTTRKEIQTLLSKNCGTIKDNQNLQNAVLIKQSEVTMQLPVSIPNYTDFYSSKEHATNVGSMFRDPKDPLLPNWLHIPIGYHGRASSVIPSGQPVRRPVGQTKNDQDLIPSFEPCKLLDFELEMGCIIGKENQLGTAIPIDQAHEYIFGMVLVNDWSARDIQKWEYVPLGPFLAKSFATTISPWIVPLEALMPFRTKGPVQSPTPLPYLQLNDAWSFDIELNASIKTSAMSTFETITKTNYKYMYWNICQQITHHASNGCNLQIGDLLASGTISGPTPDSYGSLLELTWRGTKPLQLKNGEIRKFLQDGDELSICGTAIGTDFSIGFGEANGKVLPAHINSNLIVQNG